MYGQAVAVGLYATLLSIGRDSDLKGIGSYELVCDLTGAIVRGES